MRHFTEEQHQFRGAFRKFLEAEVIPHVATWRAEGIVDRNIYKKAGEQGFLMMWADEKYGGLGIDDFRYEQIILEEIYANECADFFPSLHSSLVGPYFKNFGNEEQRARILPGCIKGDTLLAVAMTEPDAGSDMSGMRSSLRDAGDHYVLNGSKIYISNGILSDYVIVAAKDEAQKDDRHAMTLCIVERGMDGFERGRNLDKMGMKAHDTAELFFNNVKIPKKNILGEPGKGFGYLMIGLAEERLIAATGAIASARRAFDITRDYVMERKMFGKRLSSMQNTQFKMAEMDTEIEIMQVFVDHCVALSNKGELTANKAAKAKLQASEIEWRMMDLGVQLHGGSGYMQEYSICRMFTDARINRILAGSSEVMKLIIGKDALSDNYRSLFDE